MIVLLVTACGIFAIGFVAVLVKLVFLRRDLKKVDKKLAFDELFTGMNSLLGFFVNEMK